MHRVLEMPKVRTNLTPATNLAFQAIQQLKENEQKSTPRQFRDKLTRASGSVNGVPTNSTMWNRWTV